MGNREDLNGPVRLKEPEGAGKSQENGPQWEGIKSFWVSNAPSWTQGKSLGLC